MKLLHWTEYRDSEAAITNQMCILARIAHPLMTVDGLITSPRPKARRLHYSKVVAIAKENNITIEEATKQRVEELEDRFNFIHWMGEISKGKE